MLLVLGITSIVAPILVFYLKRYKVKTLRIGLFVQCLVMCQHVRTTKNHENLIGLRI